MNGGMHICMLAAQFGTVGGIERQLALLAERLTRGGDRVTILTRDYGQAIPVIEGVAVVAIPAFARSRWLTSLAYLGLGLWWLLRHKDSIDILHAHQSYSPAMLGAFARLLFRKPLLVKITVSGEGGEAAELRRLPFFGLRRRLLQRVDRFIAINAKAKEEFLELGIREDKLLHIPNGVLVPLESSLDEPAKGARRKALGLPEGDFIAVYAGRLASEKGLETLLSAWEPLEKGTAGVTLLLLGAGGRFRNVEPVLRRLAAERRLTTVRFVGQVGDVYSYLCAADAFVLPSISEGMSNALLEAMSCGLAVVATDIDASRGVVADEANGLLVPARSAEALNGALARLAGDPALRARLGRGARETMIGGFEMGIVAERYRRLYREAAACRN